MSARIVAVGPRPTVHGVVQDEVPTLRLSPMDAGACVKDGMLYVSVAQWVGSLADATVLMLSEAWVREHKRGNNDRAWSDFVKFIGQVGNPKYGIEMIASPIPVAPTLDEPWCVCGAGEFNPPELHADGCPGARSSLRRANAVVLPAAFEELERVGIAITGDLQGTISDENIDALNAALDGIRAAREEIALALPVVH